MNTKQEVIDVLKKIKDDIHPVLDIDFKSKNILIIDLTENNDELQKIDLSNSEEFTEYIFKELEENDSHVAIGRYNENRIIYAKSKLFSGGEDPRTVHLGIDIWVKPFTNVYAPIEGEVHSFNNNTSYGDYGPTIILEHKIKDVVFYTLYGHLSLDSLNNKLEGQFIARGEKFAEIGNYPTNGDWPPHLHFQIINDMLGKKGDFYGVASLKDREKFLNICPNPNLILNIEKLN